MNVFKHLEGTNLGSITSKKLKNSAIAPRKDKKLVYK